MAIFSLEVTNAKVISNLHQFSANVLTFNILAPMNATIPELTICTKNNSQLFYFRDG